MLHSRTIQAFTILFGVVFPIVGCMSGSVDVGSDDAAIGAPSSRGDGGAAANGDVNVNAIGCAEFCRQAEAKGCPKSGNCLDLCASEAGLSPGCTHEFGELLACAAPILDDTCGIPHSHFAGGGPCSWQTGHYLHCEGDDPDSPVYAWWRTDPGDAGVDLPAFRHGNWETMMSSATAGIIRSSCAEGTGLCTCTLNGEVLGQCQTLLDIPYQFPPETCCGYLIERATQP